MARPAFTFKVQCAVMFFPPSGVACVQHISPGEESVCIVYSDGSNADSATRVSLLLR